MFTLITQDGKARRGKFETAQGHFETPAFMNVATAGAVKGGLSSEDLSGAGCQVMLCNAYHLHLRPGDELIRRMGGLAAFTGWRRPTLTDSGGFQIFSLAKLRKIDENGVRFSSHIDGSEVFIGPEESVRIQSNLAGSIAMAFDECAEASAPYAYVRQSCERTLRWHERCKREMERLNRLDDTINKRQLLFGINQGACFDDLRIENMRRLTDMSFDGYALGGLAVGETAGEMYRVISTVEPHMPDAQIRYLMGVGTPVNIIEAVSRGIDLFDCVLPARNGRHGHLYTWNGILNIHNKIHAEDNEPIDASCGCEVCKTYSRGYIRHLAQAKEILALRFGVMHNLYFYNELMSRIRSEIENKTFSGFHRKYAEVLDKRV